MERFDVDKHHAEPLYVGCPHCEGPVYIGVEVHKSLSWLASLLADRVKDKKLKGELESLAADCGERAWEEIKGSFPYAHIRTPPER